jgi:hypothetical protein
LKGLCLKSFEEWHEWHDSQGVLTAVHRLALVGNECRSDFLLRVSLRRLTGLELGITTFADADGWKGALYEPELAFRHLQSLAAGGGSAIDLWKPITKVEQTNPEGTK